MQTLYNILFIAIVMLLLDIIYIQYVVLPIGFGKMIQNIQGSPMTIDLFAAIACYITLILTLWYFIVYQNKSIFDAFLLGLAIYAVYDFTNYATIKKWNLRILLTDILWGGTLFALTTFFLYMFNKTPIVFN